MFSIFKRKKEFFTPAEKQSIVEAIQNAELRTSGEVRVFVENRCSYVDALDRAVEIFQSLKMHETAERNAVLVYVAIRDHQLAVFGDEGIHQKVGKEYWNRVVSEMLGRFNRDDYAAGISICVKEIGEALFTYFPYNNTTDKNELSDDIVFGR